MTQSKPKKGTKAQGDAKRGAATKRRALSDEELKGVGGGEEKNPGKLFIPKAQPIKGG